MTRRRFGAPRFHGRESGYYPPGAEFDPSAPYNQADPPEKIPCEDCEGTGTVHSLTEENEVECDACSGSGEVDPPEYEPDDDYDEDWRDDRD